MEDRMMKRYAVIFFLLLLSFSLASAQYGKISGMITDQETKEPLIGANVLVEGTTYGAATDINGGYVILNVPAGTYTVKASYIGYQTITITNVKVLADLTRDIDIKLSNTAVQVSTVTIVAERPLIEKSATNAVRIQGAEDIQNLPVRGVQGYFTLLPGVVLQNGSVYMRGSRNDEVGFSIEGADVRDVVGTTNRYNISGSQINTIPEALEEITVQAGGYGAEYGGGNAGIVAQTFKTAGSGTKVTLQAETDNFGNYPGKKFLGTYSYGYSDYVMTLSTPIASDNIKLFAALESNFQRDRDNIWFWSGGNFGYLYDNGKSGGIAGDSVLMNWNGGNIPGRMNKRYTGNGSLLFDFKPLAVRLSGAYTWSKNQNNNYITTMFDLDRVPMQDNSNLLLNGKATYFLTNNTFVEVNLNYTDVRNRQYDPAFGDDLTSYEDSVAAAQHGWQFASLTQDPLPYNINGFEFYRPGSTLVGSTTGSLPGFLYTKNKNTSMGGSLALSSQMNRHDLKVGGSLSYWSISHYDVNPGVIFPSAIVDPDVARNLKDYTILMRTVNHVNNYGFDEFGNPLTSGADGPKHPYFAAAYIQDKVEFTDMIVNAGLRFDAMDLDGWAFSDISNLKVDQSDFTISKIRKTPIYTYVEPRLGFSFPASDRTVFHMQYGVFVQAPPLYSLYRGVAFTVYILQNGHYFNNPVGYNVQPEKTTQYEIGFSQQFSDVCAIDITGFNKNITGQLQTSVYSMPASLLLPGNIYYAYANGDFQNVLGVEVSLHVRRIERFQADLNYTLQDSRGTNSYANGTIALLNTGGVPPSMVVPLDYAETHRGSISLDYRWGKNDGGPILEQLGFNLLFTFNSGHPYTLSTGSGGQQGPDLGAILNDADARTRFPSEPINNSTTPWAYELDFRIDKSFSIGSFNINVYAYVQNLLNTQNVTNVYFRTGNAYDDGWLSNPLASGQSVINPSFGQTYASLYQVINLQNNQNQFRQNNFVNFGTPRQIRVGARIEL